MNKAQKKIVGISIASCAVLSIFASASWAIVQSSNIVPRDTSLNKYSNLTNALTWNNGVFKPQTMSVSDWININVPSKMLVEKTNDNSFILYLYTDPSVTVSQDAKPINSAEMIKIYKNSNSDITQLKKLNSMPDSPLICKIFITQNTPNLYSFKLTLNDELNTNLVQDKNDYTLIESTVQYDGNNIKNINVKNSIFKKENIEFLNNEALIEDKHKLKYSAETNGSADTNETIYKTVLETLTPNGWARTLEFSKKTSNKNSSFDFTYTSISIINQSQNSLTTKYTAISSNTNPNFNLYNLSHSHNGKPYDKVKYQNEWLSITNDSSPLFHLPQVVPFLEFYNNIDFFRTNSKRNK